MCLQSAMLGMMSGRYSRLQETPQSAAAVQLDAAPHDALTTHVP